MLTLNTKEWLVLAVSLDLCWRYRQGDWGDQADRDSLFLSPHSPSRIKWGQMGKVIGCICMCVSIAYTIRTHTASVCNTVSHMLFTNTGFLKKNKKERKTGIQNFPAVMAKTGSGSSKSTWQLCLHRSWNANRAYNGSPSATTARHATLIFSLSMSTLFCNHDSRN